MTGASAQTLTTPVDGGDGAGRMLWGGISPRAIFDGEEDAP